MDEQLPNRLPWHVYYAFAELESLKLSGLVSTHLSVAGSDLIVGQICFKLDGFKPVAVKIVIVLYKSVFENLKTLEGSMYLQRTTGQGGPSVTSVPLQSNSKVWRFLCCRPCLSHKDELHPRLFALLSTSKPRVLAYSNKAWLVRWTGWVRKKLAAERSIWKNLWLEVKGIECR